jgi:MFS family permease
MAVFMTVTFAIGAATSFFPLLNDERDFGNVGMYFFFIGGVAVIGRPIAGHISDRYGRAVVMAPALLAAVSGMIVLALAQTTELMLLSGTLGGTDTGSFALSLDRVRGNQRGSGTALGLVASELSTSSVFWTTAGFVLLLYGHSVG